MKYRGKAHFLSYWFEAKRKWKLGWFCGGLGLETIIKKRCCHFSAFFWCFYYMLSLNLFS